MKDIPAIDILRAEHLELRREFAQCDAARKQLREAYDGKAEQVLMLTEIFATMLHSRSEAGFTVTDKQRLAAWDACWLRITVDFIEDDEGGKAARVSLVPVTAAEREVNEIEAKKREAENDKPPKLELIDP